MNNIVYFFFYDFFIFQNVFIFLLILQYESQTLIDFISTNFSLNGNTPNPEVEELAKENINPKNNNILLSEKIERLEKIIREKDETNYNAIILKINEEKKLFEELISNLKIIKNDLNSGLNIKDKIILDEIKIKDKIIENNSNQLSEGEKLLNVIFVSLDQKFHYSCICKNTDNFNKIENMLYEEYPEYSKSDNHFYANGNEINKNNSLEFNKIKNNDVIILKTN